MANHDIDSSIHLGTQRLHLSESVDDTPRAIEQEHRQQELNKKRALALVGSAASQLPIWGFAMSYGVLQEYYVDHWSLQGTRELTGIIGTTSNGVMYLSMPFLFTLFTRRWAHHRRRAAVGGAILACASFMLSSLSKHVWHLIATQGILAAIGCALVFSPTTLSLGEWFSTENRICNRAVAFGICLSTKNIVGSVCPFVFRGLLDRYGFHITLVVWGASMVALAIMSICMIQTPRSSLISSTARGRKIPWHFLKHKTFWVYSIATLLQSAGYGIPQTYLSEYARNVSSLSPTLSTLLITLINIPGICSSTFFGVLSDNKQFQLSASTVTAISALSSALAAFLFWGMAVNGGVGLLVTFAITFGFFASGYSATWGGIMNDMEKDAADKNEAIDSGVLYGLLNGARGVGYVSGGLLSVPLVKAGSTVNMGRFGYGTTYGPLIVFTGLSLALGGCGLAFQPKWKRLLHL
ncbi:MFS general substrate transporter [Plenodomus tracheiphilus IPT5]|uniref:MFS general substrate transporter n=1 Tax=Plenodomus tracheiphilus IPT5 TaxID=1408161 RepID=A0A6A7B6G6_9PLEO|nr:MFS general substrate transporter [Plenodomus tracheiphilus IPT5]